METTNGHAEHPTHTAGLAEVPMTAPSAAPPTPPVAAAAAPIVVEDVSRKRPAPVDTPAPPGEAQLSLSLPPVTTTTLTTSNVVVNGSGSPAEKRQRVSDSKATGVGVLSSLPPPPLPPLPMPMLSMLPQAPHPMAMTQPSPMGQWSSLGAYNPPQMQYNPWMHDMQHEQRRQQQQHQHQQAAAAAAQAHAQQMNQYAAWQSACQQGAMAQVQTQLEHERWTQAQALIQHLQQQSAEGDLRAVSLQATIDSLREQISRDEDEKRRLEERMFSLVEENAGLKAQMRQQKAHSSSSAASRRVIPRSGTALELLTRMTTENESKDGPMSDGDPTDPVQGATPQRRPRLFGARLPRSSHGHHAAAAAADQGDSKAASSLTSLSDEAGSVSDKTATGLVYDERTLMHRADFDHVETPDRTSHAMATLKTSGVAERCRLVPSRPATDEQLLLIHSQKYVQAIDAASAIRDSHCRVVSNDTYVGKYTSSSARVAVGGLIALTERVVTGRLRNGFALIRPPGHHACHEKASGFSIFNNLAVAISVVRQKHPDAMRRVVIVDFDWHHGDGNQEAFYCDPNVLTISIHRYGTTRAGGQIYPGTGAAEETGHPLLAPGSNINLPITCSDLTDREYVEMVQMLLPVIRKFGPDVLFIAAGFDAAHGDGVGDMHVTPPGFAHMVRLLQQAVESERVILSLEGGYNVGVVAECVQSCIRTLLGDDPEPVTSEDTSESDRARFKADIKIVRSIQSAMHGDDIFPRKANMKRSEVISSGAPTDAPGNYKTRSTAVKSIAASSVAASEMDDGMAPDAVEGASSVGAPDQEADPMEVEGQDEEEEGEVDGDQPGTPTSVTPTRARVIGGPSNGKTLVDNDRLDRIVSEELEKAQYDRPSDVPMHEGFWKRVYRRYGYFTSNALSKNWRRRHEKRPAKLAAAAAAAFAANAKRQEEAM